MQGDLVDLPPLPCQASDFAGYEQRLIASDEGQRQLAYWTKQLAGLTPLTLPADRPRTVRRTTPVDRAQRPVPPRLWDRASLSGTRGGGGKSGDGRVGIG